MNGSLWGIIISSGCVLIGTIITVVVSNSKTRAELQIKQQWNAAQIEELKTTVKEHNEYAKRIPVIENDIEHIKNAIEELKNE